MIRLSVEDDRLVLEASKGDLAPRHESQLAFWGFVPESSRNRFVSAPGSGSALVEKVSAYLESYELSVSLSETTRMAIAQRAEATAALQRARQSGRAYKDAHREPEATGEFLRFLDQNVKRRLKKHQIKAALHLIATENAANFSVPGSGKTAVVLAVFEWLRRNGVVHSLFVVGAPACFGPWRTEFEETLGREPRFATLAGGDIEDRRSRYLVNRNSVKDLYLTTFQTLQRDVEHIDVLFRHQDIRFFLVIDEAHYIKRIDGAWATAALDIAGFAARRCILTGTPFPRGFSDAFNLFDVLWPGCTPIPATERARLAMLTDRGQLDEAIDVMREKVGPLFYRVRKEDLGLAPQQFHEPIIVSMRKYERRVYDSIVGQLHAASKEQYFRDLDTLVRLRRGRMMRLRQCLSYTALLHTAIDGYDEDLTGDQYSLADIVRNYDDLETPGKLDALCKLVSEYGRAGKKVVIWSNFVRTLERIASTMKELGMGVRLIYGSTPVETANLDDEISRESFIREFLARGSGVDVLVANPAACAESISLHKSCSHAIYYDLSYNCAQYLQSLDRIHRVGGSEERPAQYDFLQYEDTLDNDILRNVREKATRMSQIIDEDYPIYGLDMFAFDEELEAYERLFGG